MKEILNNDKKLFYKATSIETLRKAWRQLKSNFSLVNFLDEKIIKYYNSFMLIFFF